MVKSGSNENWKILGGDSRQKLYRKMKHENKQTIRRQRKKEEKQIKEDKAS